VEENIVPICATRTAWWEAVVDAVELDSEVELDEDEEREARGKEVRIYPLPDEEEVELDEDEERTARGKEVRIYPLPDEEEEEGEGGHALPPLLARYPPLLAPWLPRRTRRTSRCRGDEGTVVPW
jgi:hypothetical protein